jgi:hypothetical protein
MPDHMHSFPTRKDSAFSSAALGRRELVARLRSTIVTGLRVQIRNSGMSALTAGIFAGTIAFARLDRFLGEGRKDGEPGLRPARFSIVMALFFLAAGGRDQEYASGNMAWRLPVAGSGGFPGQEPQPQRAPPARTPGLHSP